jgi:hypothetical protein
VVFCILMSCGLVGGYELFRGSDYLHPEDGADMLHRNVGNHVQDHTVSQPIRPQISQVIKYTLNTILYCSLEFGF